jgi:hypothetical protein
VGLGLGLGEGGDYWEEMIGRRGFRWPMLRLGPALGGLVVFSWGEGGCE